MRISIKAGRYAAPCRAGGSAVQRRALARLLLAALACATEASALSCTAADPVRTFRGFADGGEGFAVLHGTLSFDPALLPSEGPANGSGPGGSEVMPPVPATFDGVVLGPEGPSEPLSAALLLEPVCAGQYCGYASEGPWLIFADDTAAGYVVRLGICGGSLFEPDPGTLDAVAACLRGERCEPAEPALLGD